MLRIIDSRTGEPVEAAPARRGLTRVQAHASGLGTSALRVLLVADVLVRALELGGTPVWAGLTGARQQAELRAAAATLGIRPFEDGRDLAAGLGEAQVIHVAQERGAPAGGPPAGGAVLVAVAPVTGPGREAGPGPRATPPGGAAPAGLPDPAVLRLALLAVPHATSVRLDADALDEAGHSLAHWRRAVARWARKPSRPVPEEVRGRLRAAWEDDLDVPGVLRVLRWVETEPGLPDGARFETYAYADRLLGLDLVRDLGSLA
ncbi:hypothetical protein ABZX30_35280 [Streptomyces sp. NPDC004542]|uniref:hypothetical protein n=1 Tax=Streptomyces sp. NPDC004542 TaxID=3154281 RepID=UPI00339EEEC2